MQDATPPATIATTQAAATAPGDALPSLSPAYSFSLSMDVTGVDLSFDG
jgi:hypothetical protein